MKDRLLAILRSERVRELVRYGFFGLATTLVNLGVYRLLLLVCDYRISNLIALISSKLFAYYTNKRFVFHSRCGSGRELVKEMFRFVVSRGATGLLDYVGLIVAVEVFGFDRVYSKYVLLVVVIILNYILGKKVVFQGGKENDGSPDV